MNLKEFLEATLFTIGNRIITAESLLKLSFLLLCILFLHYLIIGRFIPHFYERSRFSEKWKKRIRRNLNALFFFILLWAIISSLNLDIDLWEGTNFVLRLTTIFQILILIQLSRIIDWGISRYLLGSYNSKHGKTQDKTQDTNSENKGSRIVQSFVYLAAAILLVNNLNIDFTVIPIKKGDVESNITFSGILYFFLAFIIARLVIWILVNIVLFSYYKNKGIETGRQFAANQLFSYIAYTIAAIVGIKSLGVDMTLVWGGAAALLVGIGLGLQQTFNDFFSGIILLFERTVEVGDVLYIEGEIGIVRKIGLRASTVTTADHVSLIIPNSKLVMNKVTNWNHVDEKVRFTISVGVAYGSDTELVKKLLIDVGRNNFNVINYPPPLIRFKDFGDSALQFEMLFWTYSLINIEDLKSDLRFQIDRVFRENDIHIPFPQRTIWMNNQE